jgi:hypothetical protein
MTGLTVAFRLRFPISFVVEEDADPIKRGSARSAATIVKIAIARYEREPLKRDGGAEGESLDIVGFSLRTDLKLSRKRDWAVIARTFSGLSSAKARWSGYPSDRALA